MSLINQMLNDLESRQAYLDEASDKALNGLHHSDFYEYGEDNGRSRLLFMVLSIILISVIIYAISSISSLNYFSLENDWKMFSGISDPVVESESKKFVSKISPIPIDNAADKDSMLAGLISVDRGNDMDVNTVIEADISRGSNVDDRDNMPSVDKLFPALTLEQVIDLPGEVSGEEPLSVSPVEKITSLKIADSDDGVAIDLQFSMNPEYSLYTLQDPSRLVLELKDFKPVDTGNFQETYPQSVKLRTRSMKNDNYQLIFEFTQPVSLQDTWLTELDQGVSLHIALLDQLQDTGKVGSGHENIDQRISENELPLSPKPVVVTNEPRIEKKVHKYDLVRRSDDLYQEGLTAVRDDNVIAGIDKLYLAISDYPKNHKARVALVEILIEQGDKQAARDLLTDGLALKPDQSTMAKLLGQLLVEERNNRMALFYLERALPDVHADPEYHALVAAVLQREERHQEAIMFYRNVLTINADNGIWWMGLGISLEATGAGQQALSAYRRARQDNTISTSVAKYLDSRIIQLNRRQAS